MAKHLNDFIAHVNKNARISITLLNDTKRHFKSVTRGNSDLVCEKLVEEPLIKNGGCNLEASPKKLPPPPSALKDRARNFDLSDFDDLPGVFVISICFPEDYKVVSRDNHWWRPGAIVCKCNARDIWVFFRRFKHPTYCVLKTR